MLSSWKMTKISYAWIWSNKRIILKLLSPIIILICLGSAINFSGIKDAIIYIVLIYIVSLYFISTSMVQIHRIIILPGSTSKTEIFPKYEKPFSLYLVAWIALNIINKILDSLGQQLLSNTGSYFPIFVYFLIVILSIYGLTRAYFIFPAIAIKKNLSSILSMTENKFWIVFKSLLLLFVPILLLHMVGITLISAVLSSNWLYPYFYIMYLVFFAVLNIHYSTLFSELSKSKQSK